MTISREEFKEKLDSGEYTLIDVRTPEEHQQRNIEGSTLINIMDPEFQNKIQKLDKNKKYLVYCKGGTRSNQAMNFMHSLGFGEVYELQGGILNWN